LKTFSKSEEVPVRRFMHNQHVFGISIKIGHTNNKIKKNQNFLNCGTFFKGVCA